MVDHNQSAVNADGGQHRREQSRLVLAVAVAIAEDIGGVVRLVAADAHLDDEVTNPLLNELGDGLGLVVEVGLVTGEFFGFGGNLWGCGEAVPGEVLIPLSDALPASLCGRSDAWAGIVHGHTAFERGRIGAEHDVIEIDGWGFLHLPTPALVLEVGGRDLLGMGPDGAVGKAGWKLEGEALVEARQIALEEPGLFGQIGMASLLVLVGDDAAGVAAGSVCGSHLQIHEEVALAGIANFDHLVVFDGILVAVGADAPDMHRENLAVLVEGDGDDALLPALGPENFNDVTI